MNKLKQQFDKFKQDHRKGWRRFLTVTLFVYIIFVCIVFLVGFTVLLGDDVQTGIFLLSQVHNFKSNNLTYPQNYNNSLILNRIVTKDDIDKLFNVSVQDYKLWLQQNYFYDKSQGYDCKYWTVIHFIYWSYHNDKYGWSIKTVKTDNHIFALMYNDTSYCIADGKNFDCYD